MKSKFPRYARPFWRPLKKLLIFFFRATRALFLDRESIRRMNYILETFRAARGLFLKKSIRKRHRAESIKPVLTVLKIRENINQY